MTELFRNVLEASLHGGILIAVVLLARLALKKVPKKYICLLWLLAALRLLLPFEIESGFSLQPELGTVTIPGSGYAQSVTTGFDSGVGEAPLPSVTVPDAGKTEQNVTVDLEKNAVVYEREVPLRVTILENYDRILAWSWFVVAVGLLGYSVVSYLRLRRRVRDAVILSEGVWVSGRIDSPFVMGFFRPRIYLNPSLGGREREYVLAHERSHIRRGDHWWKWLGFLTLAVHWFNPLVWLGYVLLCRDLEMACDEAVVKEMAVAERKAYSAALLACSARSRTIAACPVAFGEVSVKQRITNVLNYRKPKFWLILAAVVAVVVIALCFLTSPVQHSVLAFAGVSAEEVTGMMMTNDMGIASVSGKEAADALDILKVVRYDPEIDAFLAPTPETGELHRIDIQCGTEYVTVCFTPDFNVVYREDYSEVRYVRNPERLEALFQEMYNGVTHRETSGEPFATAADAYAWANGIRLDAVEEAEFTRYRYIEDHSKTTRGTLRETGFLELLEVLNDLPENAFMESPALKGKDIVRADAFDFDYDGTLTFGLTSVTIQDGVNGLVVVLRYYMDIYGEEKLELIITDDMESFKAGNKYLNNVRGWFVADEALLEFMREMAEAPPIVRYWDGYWSGIEPNDPPEPADGWTQTHWGTTAYCNNIHAAGMTLAFDQTDTSVTDDLFYGQDFALERWDGTDWVPMPPVIDNGSFTTEALLLSKGTTTFLNIDWEWLYGELPEGYYCLSKTLRRGSESRVFRVYFGIYEFGGVWIGSFNNDLSWPVNTVDEDAMIAAVSGKVYEWEKLGFGSDFTITVNEDGSFTYYEGLASSYIGTGTWIVDGDTLILLDEGMGDKIRHYYFTVTEDALIFQAEGSHDFIYVDVADGDRFFLYGDVPQQMLTNETVVNMCAAAYTELRNAARFWVLVSTPSHPYPFGTYQYVDGENYFIDGLPERGYNTLKYNGTVYFYVQQDYMEDKSIPTGWMTDRWVREHYGAALDGTREAFPWEVRDWDAFGLALERWERQDDGLLLELTEKADPDHQWSFKLDGKGDLESITSAPDGRIDTQWTIRGINGAYIDEIPLWYAEACRSVPDAVIVRDQAFYEELFTRQTDGHFTTDWISHLYEAFYAEPEEFARQMARIYYSEDAERVLDALTCMSYEIEFYEPERYAAELEKLRNVPDLDQSAVDLLYRCYWEGEYRALGGDSAVMVADSGQDYLAAALEGCETEEGYHLQVSSGSPYRYTYVSCQVEADDDITDLYRENGTFDENTYAFDLTVIAVPENEMARMYAMAGNTHAYAGTDPDVPEGALVYYRCGYVQWTETGWYVQIVGSGW